MIPASIIIPAWNEAKTLEPTLQALLDVDYDKEICEVIVVAGGVDDTYQMAQELSERMEGFGSYVVMPQKPRGKNSAIQQGLKEATNDIIVLLDADTIVGKHWLRNMVAPIEQGMCDLAIAGSEPLRKNWISDYYMVLKMHFLDSITTYPGHSVAFKANIVKNQIEYFFDRGIWMGDDYLFEKRVSELGHKTMFVDNANVKTHFPTSLQYFFIVEFRWLTAFAKMNGVRYKTLAYNAIVIGSMVSIIPFFRVLVLLSLFFNTLYVGKRAHMFLSASRRYKTRSRRIFGFVMLSYLHHVISFCSYMKYFLGSWKDPYYQGQRY